MKPKSKSQAKRFKAMGAPERTPLPPGWAEYLLAFIDGWDGEAEDEAAFRQIVSGLAALEQERSMPCGHAQRMAVHSSDFLGDDPGEIGTSYCGECERIAKLEQEVERLQGLVDTIAETAKNRMAEVERLRAAVREMPCRCKKDFAGDRGGDYECHRCRALTKPEGEE